MHTSAWRRHSLGLLGMAPVLALQAGVPLGSQPSMPVTNCDRRWQLACTFYPALASRIAYPQMRQFRSNQKPKISSDARPHKHLPPPYLMARWLLLVYIAEHALGHRSEAAKERIIAFGIVLVLVLVAVLGVLTFVGMEFITNAVR
jgi:hypothetical protein